jgi:tetratricopeptide (TPR) repeat protein
MNKIFISHSSQDDAFVRDLRAALADQAQEGWIDSRELRGGDPLWTEIQRAIEGASAYAVVVSTEALQSKWVGKELRHALEVQKKRSRDKFPIIPLSLNSTKLGVLEEFFGEEPIYIPVSSDAGGVESAMNAILIAMGKRLPADVPATAQPKAEPLEELVLELTDLKFHERDGVRRASARARLVYEPATPGQPHVHSAQSWRLVTPIGPIEAEELRWYLEKYAIWPSEYFRDRARKVEADLVKWGQLLHEAAMPAAHRETVMKAWEKIGDHAGRRFSVLVDVALEAGAPEADVKAAQEVATLLLGLPWELLHDGKSYLFQGAKPVRVRRRLPGTEAMGVAVVATPIRVLLVTARPEDDSCGYIDHRASALPLVEAMESLPGLVKIHILSPPTLPALRDELNRARAERKPYHVVHFDGHGVYDRTVGLGGLCFEHPEDIGKLEKRRHVTVFTQDTIENGTGLGSLLRDHRIPLVFLEACQTAQAEKASESVASELLKVGVASVVAMSHSVLVETARRFVEAFYDSLAFGARVGDAMLAGQRQLKDDTFRGRIFGAGELRLEDWFVPVLYQEKDDPQLFKVTPAKQTQEDFQTALAARLGDLPPAPETGFIGRSRELLALQRLLCGTGVSPVTAAKHGLEAHATRYAVVRGQGGEGKTALAAEFARWMVRSQQMRRAAFVSVEGLEKNIVESIADKLGQQLLKPGFSTQIDCNGELAKAKHEIERVLREQPTLLVMDNMESILLPPFIETETPEALSQEAREELKAILALCERLLKVGETRIVFTSREALPAPFDSARHRRELHQLDHEDAVKLIERVLNCGTGFQPVSANSHEPKAHGLEARATSDAAREEIEQLVDAVHCHARTLALLAPALRSAGVEATRESLVELMAEMEDKFPGSREKSVFASVELSLRRMTEANRDRVRVLAVFHGGVNLIALQGMTGWEETDVTSLAGELVETGLATPNRYNHLTLNPALCPYLRGRMDATEGEALTARWVEAMRTYAKFLVQQQSEKIEVAATLTVLELPNLFALLDLAQRAGDAESTIDLTTTLYGLLQNAGKPRLLERVGQVRDAAAAALGDAWNHARFSAALTRIEQQRDGRLREAFDGAQQLLQRARSAGEQAYSHADYDLAMACILLARVLKTVGGSEQALPLLDEARQRFEAVAKTRPGRGAEGMAAACFSEQGDCLRALGRLDEAAAAYDERIRRGEQLGDDRGVAVGKGQLGTVRMYQRRDPEALAAHAEARERFTKLGEPGSVAVSWHQTGMVYQQAGQPEAAEDAYRKSLAIKVRLRSVAGQATTLVQLGNLYDDDLNRPEEAVAFYRQAADKYVEIGDAAKEGVVRTNLAATLRKLRRLEEARHEIRRAIECGTQFGHASSPWVSWSNLADIETDAGNPSAAAEAKRKATACYLAYRRDDGENHFPDGRIALSVTESLLAGDHATATSLLEQFVADSDLPSQLGTFIQALQAIVAGSRDRSLADAPELTYAMAAEILFLIETLEKRASAARVADALRTS